jgi:hypothetical protein
MLETVLGYVALWCWLYFTAKPSHVGGQCGWARLPSAPTYDLQLSDEGTGLPARRCLVLSLLWAVAPFRGMRSPRL